jgi:hypothetical protein
MRTPVRSAFRDHYAVLGVGVDATEAEVKAAYREKAKQCHPDLHPGDAQAAARFRQISEARRVLLSPSERARFNLDRLERRHAETVAGMVAIVVRRADPVWMATRPPRIDWRRPGWEGALLVLGGILTVLLSISVLPFVTITGGPDPAPVSGLDGGAWAGVLNGGACAVLAALTWVCWQGPPGRRRREGLLAVAALWLLAVTAAEFDPHVLVGGFFTSDLAPAAGARLLPVGVALTVCGAWVLRPSPDRRSAGQSAPPAREIA